MNLKKTVLSLMAAGTILLGGAAGVNAQSASNTGTGNVTIATNGTFNVQFCNANFDFTDVTLNSTNPTGTSNASVAICYTDTQASRGTFRTFMSAGHFSDGNGHYITNDNINPAYIIQRASGAMGSDHWQYRRYERCVQLRRRP